MQRTRHSLGLLSPGGIAGCILVLLTSLVLEPGGAQADSGDGVPKARFGFSTKYHDDPDAGRGSLWIDRLSPGGPADRAGLRVGDRIIALDGQAFRFENDAQAFRGMARFTPGQAIALTYQRDNETLTTTLTPTKATPEQVLRNAEWLRRAEAAGGRACIQSAMEGTACLSEIRSRVQAAGGRAVLWIERRPGEAKVFSATSNEIELPAGFDWRHHWPTYGLFIDTMQLGEKFAIEIRVDGDRTWIRPILKGTRWESSVVRASPRR